MVKSSSRPSVATALILAGSAAILLIPAASFAQIEEVVVTARKRAESLQEVPIAINAITAEELDRKAINSISDMTKGLSSVEFDEGAAKSDTRITIRGLSPTRGRQNVAVLVDGIDVSTEAISNSGGGVLLNTRLVDIERVDILKGPQMALYGRSAFAGAIQYVTKDPSDVFESTFSMDGNAEDQYSATMGLSGPVLGDKLGLRFNAAWWDEEGFYNNALTGDSLADDEGFGLALTAKSQLTDSFSLKFRAEYQDQTAGPTASSFLKFNDETLLPAVTRTPFTDPETNLTYPAQFRCFEKLSSVTWNPGLDARNDRLFVPGYTPTGPDSALPNVLYSSPHCETAVATVIGAAKNFNERDIAVSTNPFTNQDYEGIDRQLIRLSLVAEWELDAGTITSHTGYIHEDATEDGDNGKFGFTPDPASISPLTGAPYNNGSVNMFLLTTDKLTTQFSQELMYRTNLDGPLQVTAGALYWQEDVGNSSDSFTVQASGSHCAWASATGLTFDDFGFVAPGTGCYGYTERAAAPLMRGGFNFANGEPYEGIGQYKDSSPADRNTEHESLFGMLEYEVNDSVKAIFEGRMNWETVEAVGPQFLDPTASGGPGSWNPCGFFFRPCTDEFLFSPPVPGATGPEPLPTLGGPFYSLAAFEAWYDSYDPNALVDDDPPPDQGNYPDAPPIDQRYRDIIPDVCRNDPSVVKRLANVDAGNPDQFDLFNPYCVTTISRDDDWFSPKLTLTKQVNDDLNTYISWAQSEKPGGFSTLGIGSSGLNRELLEFEPEKLRVYELGMKSQWLDRTLIVNSAFFFQDFTDKQTLVSVLNAAGDRIVNKLENVDGAEVLGLEVDVEWSPMETFLRGNWSLRGSYTYLDAEYVDASVENTSFTFISGAGNCAPKVVTALNGDQAVVCNVSLDGKKLEDAPEGKFVGSVAYNLPLANDLNFFVEADFLWIDKRFIEATNENWVEADTNVDLRIGLRTDKWDVTGYVSNLFDDDTIASAAGGPSLGCCFILGSGIDLSNAEPPADDPDPDTYIDEDPQEPGKTVIVELPAFRYAFAPDPRVIGLRARYRFGGE